MAKITTQQARVGRGTVIWFAFVDGVMLRDKRGVGRRFKTDVAAKDAALKSKAAA